MLPVLRVRMDGPVLCGGHQDARLAPHEAGADSSATGSVRASRRTRNLRVAGVPTDDSMTPETRDQPVATPANARTQDARPRTVDVPDASPASGRTRANCARTSANPAVDSGELPDDRQARGHRAGGGGDPAQGASHPERAGDGPAASSHASHRGDARQPPGGGALAGGSTGHAPEDRQTSGPDALAERHAREGVDRCRPPNSNRSDMAYFWTAISKHSAPAMR